MKERILLIKILFAIFDCNNIQARLQYQCGVAGAGEAHYRNSLILILAPAAAILGSVCSTYKSTQNSICFLNKAVK